MKNVSKLLIIYYKGANKGKFEQLLPEIKRRLSARYSVVDAIAGVESNDSEQIAYKNAEKYDVIVSCGGDGTLHQVVNGVMKRGANTLVGVLPFGTCNDVARSINIPKKLNKAIDCLLRLNTIKYDLLFDGSEYITYSLAAGYVAPVSFATSSKLKKVFGRFAYFLTAVKYLFTAKRMPTTITYDGEMYDGKTPFVLLANGKSVAGFNFNKKANMSNGKVQLVILRGNTFINFFRLARMFMFGVKSIKKCKSAIVEEVSSVEIRNHSNCLYTMDGERCEFLKKNLTVNTSITFITR